MKVLIIEACAIAGEATSVHADVGEVVDVTKDEALPLCRMGRAMYVEKSDDPTKGTLTASDDDKKQAKKRAAQIADAAERKAFELQAATPAGLTALIAAEVAKATQVAAKA